MRSFIFKVSLFILLTGNAFGQVGIEKAEAMFIYNIARLVEWPADYRTGSFVIGILGTSEVANELTAYVVGKKVGFQDIEIKRFKTPDEVAKCHILFIPYAKTALIADVASKVGNFSTLIISEKKGGIELGATINFLVLETKLSFELKPDNAVKCNLKISTRLKEMAASLK